MRRGVLVAADVLSPSRSRHEVVLSPADATDEGAHAPSIAARAAAQEDALPPREAARAGPQNSAPSSPRRDIASRRGSAAGAAA